MRPRKRRRIRFRPGATYFKPVGVPLRHLDEVALRPDEAEAIRLRYVEGLKQKGAAKKMKISQSTFHRTLISANKKIARALIKGHAIRLSRPSS